MRIERFELREIQMPLVAPFITSFELFFNRRIVLIQAFDRDGATGWGECVATEQPLYNHEFIDGAWLLARDFLIPKLLDKEI